MKFIKDLRRQMHKFATLQLRDSDLAEDVVQEALAGAIKNTNSFNGQKASVKTWVFAILRNKIIDIFRQKQRLINFSDLLQEDGEAGDLSELFNKKGRWHMNERPVAWAEPEESMQNDQFWIVFEACLENLPGNQARVFMMREIIGLDAHEICATVNITDTNLGVMMYRARIRLRECLENRWFEGKKET